MNPEKLPLLESEIILMVETENEKSCRRVFLGKFSMYCGRFVVIEIQINGEYQLEKFIQQSEELGQKF